ncbi:MAG: hypothetical protein IID45_15960, partial [Planctomycetes bacterium]|nr:hypothetical protein [Planctomycetota bacterium]
PEFQQFFGWPNLMYLWVALGITKVIHEFGPDAEVLIFSQSADVKRIPLRQLFPESFGPTALKPEE